MKKKEKKNEEEGEMKKQFLPDANNLLGETLECCFSKIWQIDGD